MQEGSGKIYSYYCRQDKIMPSNTIPLAGTRHLSFPASMNLVYLAGLSSSFLSCEGSGSSGNKGATAAWRAFSKLNALKSLSKASLNPRNAARKAHGPGRKRHRYRAFGETGTDNFNKPRETKSRTTVTSTHHAVYPRTDIRAATRRPMFRTYHARKMACLYIRRTVTM